MEATQQIREAIGRLDAALLALEDPTLRARERAELYLLQARASINGADHALRYGKIGRSA